MLGLMILIKMQLSLFYGNVRLTGCENCVKITRKEYEKCLKQIHTEGESFDIIFLDPPYECNFEEKLLKSIIEYNALNKDGVIVLESDKRKDVEENIPGLNLKDKRTYGRVIIRLYELEE